MCKASALIRFRQKRDTSCLAAQVLKSHLDVQSLRLALLLTEVVHRLLGRACDEAFIEGAKLLSGNEQQATASQLQQSAGGDC